MRQSPAVPAFHSRPRLGKRALWQTALCLLFAAQAQADFYRYVGDDGVETFTNTPTNSRAVKVLRETKPDTEAKREPKRVAEAKREPKMAAQATAQFSGEHPLLPVMGTVTSNVGWRHDPIDGGIKHHDGVDIAVPSGTRVKAIAAGRVVQSGARGGYGNLVAIDHGDGSLSLYGHNSRLEVRVVDLVAAGQTIALSGSTGRSTGPHLHFELWRSGSNITEAYLRNGAGIPEVTGGIRTYLHRDGSIVFTNNR